MLVLAQTTTPTHIPQAELNGEQVLYIPPNERTWLIADLAGTTKDTIVFCHFRLDTDNASYLVTNVGVIRDILEDSGKVRHVFTGHRHLNSNLQSSTTGYHVMEAMTENAHPENAFSIVKIFDNGWVTVTGTDRQESYSFGVPVC